MKTIAKYNCGFKLNDERIKHFEIKLLTNSNNNDNGIYVIIDWRCNEHECGIWERIKNKSGKTYIYKAVSFNEVSKGKSINNAKYYSSQDVCVNEINKYIREKENEI